MHYAGSQPLQNQESHAAGGQDEEMSGANEIGSHLIHASTVHTSGEVAASAAQEAQEFSNSPNCSVMTDLTWHKQLRELGFKEVDR